MPSSVSGEAKSGPHTGHSLIGRRQVHFPFLSRSRSTLATSPQATALGLAASRYSKSVLPLRSASAALGWWVANLGCELFASQYPDRYMRLRYEDLARAPRDEIQGLFAKLVPGSEWPAEAIGGCDNRHQLYGNRMRAANLSLAEVREDAAWQRDMPRLYRVFVSLLTAPLRWRYGYA